MNKKLVITLTTTALVTSLSLGLTSTAAFATSSPGSLSTLTKGILTIGTDDPAYSPWFDNNKPADGKGFELNG
jgi:hypothetical protein